MRSLSGLVAGLIFGVGLLISGMGNPTKVMNFLDVFGTWDPSLAFVMGGAIAVTAPAFWRMQRQGKPLFAQAYRFPAKMPLDARLLGGAALFGVGWGASGFCPGPALTAIAGGHWGTLVFVAAMLIAMGTTRAMLDASQSKGAGHVRT